MFAILLAKVQLDPITNPTLRTQVSPSNSGDSPIEIKRNCTRTNVRLENILELVEGNGTRIITAAAMMSQPKIRRPEYGSLHIEVLEGGPIVRVRTLQKRFEYYKIVPRDQTPLGAIGNAE